MAFFRFNRDKRGYEYFYLVEPVTNRRGKTRTRLLYWYRTPPNVRVGRAPFDEQVQRALEAQNPNVTFDWPKIIDAPIPSAEADKWRERRRAEKAEKAARQGAVPRRAVDVASEEAEPASEQESGAPAAAAEQPAAGAPVQGTREHPYHVTSDQIRKKRRRRRGRGRTDAAPAPHVESPGEQGAAQQVSEQSPPAADPPDPARRDTPGE